VAGKRSSGLGGLLLLVVGGIAWVVAQYGKEILVLGGIALAVWIAYKIFGPKVQPPVVAPPPTPAPPALRATPAAPAPTAPTPSGITFSVRGPGFVPGRPTSTNGDEFWQALTVEGKPLGAWAYSGKGLAAVSGDGIEPALLESSAPVDRSIQECRTRRLSYWPSYGGASPDARGAYVHWLGTGLKDPEADIGYVFLYFYGLERRALHDAAVSQVAKSQLPTIQKEIERLLSVYKDNYSFQNYAGSLLDLLNNRAVDPRLYERSPPPLRGHRLLTFHHRIALGQVAADGAPLPAEWAYAWYLSDPTTYLRTPAARCPEEFHQLFLLRYQEVFGDGINVPKNRTQLKMVRRPASPTFGWGFPGHTLQFDLPDVTVLTSPVKKLQEVAESCYARLDGYSRFIGKNGSSTDSFDAIVELPIALWPADVRKPVEDVRALVQRAGKPLAIPFEKLRAWFPAGQLANKRKWQALCRAFGELGLGVEPDVCFGGAVPSAGSTAVLFADDAPSSTATASSRYTAAALTLQLGAAVALADGNTLEAERGLLTRQLEDWLHLSESERRRLHAFLRLVLAAPPKLNGVKAKVETLDATQRQAIGDFVALIALADSSVTPAEVTALEQTFRLLGLDPKSVYSKIHIAATEPVTVQVATPTATGRAIPKRPVRTETSGFRLDPAKVAALQADSERISAILGSIFAQAVPEPEPEETSAEAEVTLSRELPLLGLDTEHSALVRILLSRTQWARVELEELATDRGVMLDGALERVNDAAFDKFNKPLLDGLDPVEINQELAHEVLQ